MDREFSFTIPVQCPTLAAWAAESNSPLESNDASGGTLAKLRGVEGGVPCYRGSPAIGEPIYAEENHLDSRTVKSGAAAWVSAGSYSVQATEAQIGQWNSTRRQGFSEPWKQPSIFVQGAQGPETPTSPDDDAAGRRSAQGVLQSFIDTAGVKILLVDHVLYGWDLIALQEAVFRMIQEEQTPAQTSNRTKIRSLSVIYEHLPAWLDLQVKRPNVDWNIPTTFGRSGGGHQDGWIIALAIGCLSLLPLAIGILVDSYQKDLPAEKTWGWILALCNLGLLCAARARYLQLAQIKIFDTLILAHPLVHWQSTGLPPSLSQREAIDHLCQLPAFCESSPPQINLARHSDGWHVLRGARELDWLAEYRDIILRAIKRKETGDLTLDVIRHVQQRAVAASALRSS